MRPNNALRQLRVRTPSRRHAGETLSRSELADLLNRWLLEATGKQYGLDANYIGKLERANITRPQALYRRAFSAVLDTPESELGFAPETSIGGDDKDSDWGTASVARTGHLLDRLRHAADLPFHEPAQATGVVEAFMDSPARVLTMTGPPGVGKSRLALETARRLHPDIIVQMHNGAEFDSDVDLAREILRYDSHAVGTDPLLELEVAVAETGRPILIIIDSLDTPARITATARQCDGIIRQIYDDRVRFLLCIRTPPAPNLERFPLLHASVGEAIELSPWAEETARRIWADTENKSTPGWNQLSEPLRRMARTPILMHMIRARGPQGHDTSGNTFALIEQCLKHELPRRVIEHDIVEDFHRAEQHLAELESTRTPAHAGALLNTLADESRADARAHEVFGLTVAGLFHRYPDLLSSAALSPTCEPQTTLPLLLNAATEHDLVLNREVVRSAAALALTAAEPRLATTLLRYTKSALTSTEQAEWIAKLLETFGSQLWPEIDTRLTADLAELGPPLAATLDLTNTAHATFTARYLSVHLPMGADAMRRLQRHPDWRVRAALAESTPEHPQIDERIITDLANDPDYKVRARLAESLQNFKATQAEAILEVLLTDPNWFVRTTAVHAVLKAAPDSQAQFIPVILKHFRAPEWRHCPRAISTAIEKLETQTADGDPGLVVTSTPPALDHTAVRCSRADYRRLRGKRALQVALDLYDLDQALEIATEVARAGADLIEIGDPLIKVSGIAAIEAVKTCAPDTLIVAEMMSADWGRDQVNLAASAGADAVLLIGPASPASMRRATAAAINHDIPVTLDMPITQQRRDWIQTAELAGVDGLTITTNIDLGIAGSSPLERLERIRHDTTLPIAVSGGFSLSDPEVMVNPNWDILIVGRAIVDAVEPAQATRQLLDLINQSNP